MKRLLTLSFCILTLCGAEAAAFEVPKVKEILVEETEETKALKERRESSYAKTVITRKEMEELGGQTAADVLRRLPRLYFSGPPATNKDIRMVGLDKEFQNVLINGNRPPGGGEKREFALDRIPVEMIERIEILKNPTAAYDSDAIAGLVNIVLKEEPKTASFSSYAGLSYNDMADKLGNKLALSYGNRIGPWGFIFGGTRNDEYRGNEKSKEDGSKDEAESETEVVRTITSSLNLGVTYHLGKSDRISFKPYWLRQTEKKEKEKLVSTLSTGTPKSKNIEGETKEQELQSYGLEWEHRFSGGAGLKVFVSYSENDEDKDKTTEQYKDSTLTFDKDTFEKEKKQDKESVASIDYKMPFIGPFETEHILSSGVKYRDKDRNVDKTVYEVNKSGKTTVTSTADDSYRVEEKITAFYLLDEASLSERLVISPGLRVEITDGGYLTSGGREGKGSFTDWNPSLHVLYKLGKGYQARASLARTIGRPSFKDKVPTRSEKKDKIEEGNPDLKASKSMNYEVGLEKYFDTTGVIAVGAFYKDVKDVIEKLEIGTDTTSGKPIVKPVNVSDASIEGIELEAKVNLGFMWLRDFTLSANYTLLGSEVQDPTTGVTRRLKDQPETLANAILRYDSGKRGLSASLGMNYIGEKIDESDPAKGRKAEKAFTQWDISVKKTLFRHASLFGSVINMFNEKREKIDGSKLEKEEVGRTFLVGLRYEL
ncbi:MAG: TonB-dependent receptor [Alphaproteobacteria bacterium]|uniref:TonB-dependent receptor n=1 Tax=Candidatus Nitrobium versatile TaxID=2884831 RepID=A0A953M296_9BACT|nr:TonB-dependent receptor [Candidatus Nitrobium versatile]